MTKTGPDLNGYSRWVRRVLKEFKDERNWGITRVAQEGGVSRNLLTNWRDANWTQGKPTRDSVERFCDNLNLKKEEPFGHLRLALEPARGGPKNQGLVEAPPEPDLDRFIRRIEIRLSQKPPAEERRDLELKLVRARRARDAKRLADELIAEIETDLDLTMDE